MNKFLSALLASTLACTGIADAKLSTEGFGSEIAPYHSSVFEYIPHSNRIKHAIAMIGSANSGQQRIYFMLSIDEENMCTVNDENTYSNIAKINNKNIKVYTTCEKTDPSKPTFIVMTALTDKGDSWVISQFEKRELINFQYLEWNVNFNTNGFREAWKAFGGNAF